MVCKFILSQTHPAGIIIICRVEQQRNCKVFTRGHSRCIRGGAAFAPVSRNSGICPVVIA